MDCILLAEPVYNMSCYHTKVMIAEDIKPQIINNAILKSFSDRFSIHFLILKLMPPSWPLHAVKEKNSKFMVPQLSVLFQLKFYFQKIRKDL